MKPATIEDSHIIARQFAAALTELLGPHTMRAIVDRNASEPHPDVCHSHDYCDANVVMMDAFLSLGFECSSEPAEDSGIGFVWDEAWALAKGAEFDLYKLDAIE